MKCIRTRPGLSTARTQIARGNTRTRSLTSWGIPFRPRVVKNRKHNSMFVSFTPAVSSKALNGHAANDSHVGTFAIGRILACRKSRGCTILCCGVGLNIMGDSIRRRCIRSLRHFNKTLVAWAMRKFKRFKGHKTRQLPFLIGIAKTAAASVCSLAAGDGVAHLLDGSGVSREAPAPFCEGPGVKFLRSTHHFRGVVFLRPATSGIPLENIATGIQSGQIKIPDF